MQFGERFNLVNCSIKLVKLHFSDHSPDELEDSKLHLCKRFFHSPPIPPPLDSQVTELVAEPYLHFDKKLSARYVLARSNVALCIPTALINTILAYFLKIPIFVIN